MDVRRGGSGVTDGDRVDPPDLSVGLNLAGAVPDAVRFAACLALPCLVDAMRRDAMHDGLFGGPLGLPHREVADSLHLYNFSYYILPSNCRLERCFGLSREPDRVVLRAGVLVS